VLLPAAEVDVVPFVSIGGKSVVVVVLEMPAGVVEFQGLSLAVADSKM
jgi:hypothetical protein